MDPVSAAQEFLSRFGWAYSYRGSLFLIAGGVFLLGVLVLVLLVQSTLFGTPVRREEVFRRGVLTGPPAPPPHLPAMATVRIAREALDGPALARRMGVVAGGALPAATLDDALDRFVRAGLGDPRVVATTSRTKAVAVTACRTCSAVGARQRAGALCSYEEGFLEGCLSAIVGATVKVRETSCRLAGDTRCLFEVSY